jgi:hypothetical protein
MHAHTGYKSDDENQHAHPHHHHHHNASGGGEKSPGGGRRVRSMRTQSYGGQTFTSNDREK